MRLVLDTNVIISALFWGGIPGQILKKSLYKHTLCFSEKTLTELEEVITYPKFETRMEKLTFSVEEFLDRLTMRAIVISSSHQKISAVKDDPSDNEFLACAIICRASFIISGDKHLLRLRKFHAISILSPSEFLKKFSG